MIVTFISQCEKNALKKTRYILDNFANRIGDRTWQTPITKNGLDAIKKLLRQKASKNTAVSCHLIRGYSRTELLWVVGKRNKFDHLGKVPIATTKVKVVNTDWENDWHYMPLIKSLTALAALLHDWGKASNYFQAKLKQKPSNKQADPLRHEWISCILFSTFIQQFSTDDEWLDYLANENISLKLAKKSIDNPFNNLPKVAKLLLWLMLTHHRLPNYSKNKDNSNLLNDDKIDWEGLLNNITSNFGYNNENNKQLDECFKFNLGLLEDSLLWKKQLKKWALRLKECLPLANKALENNSWRLILYHARLSLMLGDHNYSSKDTAKRDNHDKNKLYANTDINGILKQELDEHLVGVCNTSLQIAHILPRFETSLPYTNPVTNLQKKSVGIFKWQDHAVDAIKKWQSNSKNSTQNESKNIKEGFFVVNMASTGCGKTIANAKIMQSLLAQNDDTLRYTIALGLRTLTLQTGDEYRKQMDLSESELAVIIGSQAVKDLHATQDTTQDEELIKQENIGSESLEDLFNDEIDYEDNILDDKLTTVLKNRKSRKLLYAPVLVCTIDHIIQATETIKGGKYILPSLRLMSADLIIDEIDDFDGKDLVAIGRLIHLAGMLGRRVIISSATIPPSIADGYFHTYKEGWSLFSKSRIDSNPSISCAWIDEFNTTLERVEVNQDSNKIYCQHHNKFITKRVSKLEKQPVRRKAEIIPIPYTSTTENIEEIFCNQIQKAIIEKHNKHNTIDPKSGKKVSFGVVRVAHIPTCIDLAKGLMEKDWVDVGIKIMAYHSRQVLLLRSRQEKHLDEVLKRKEKDGEIPKAFNNPIIREHINNSIFNDIIFILVATPVEEVGRDHDFDWAIIEPSSFRSIIQLAGRVKRHRIEEANSPNIGLLQYNLKALKNINIKPRKKAYINPGYEGALADKRLKNHDLTELLKNCDLNHITSIPRILSPNSLEEESYLIDLEHYAISQKLNQYQESQADAMEGYITGCWWLTGFNQKANRFRESQENIRLYLILDDEKLYFVQKYDNGDFSGEQERFFKIKHQPFKSDNLWLKRDYQELLQEYPNPEQASKKYGEILISLRDEDKEKIYSDQFGLNYKK